MNEMKTMFKSKTAVSILMISGLIMLGTAVVYADAGILNLNLLSGPDSESAKYGSNCTSVYGTITAGNQTQELNGNYLLQITPSNNQNKTAQISVDFINGTGNVAIALNQNTREYNATVTLNNNTIGAGYITIDKGDASIASIETSLPNGELTAGSVTDVFVAFGADYPITGTASLTLGGQQYTADMSPNNTAVFNNVTLPSEPGNASFNVSLSSDLYSAEPKDFEIDVLSDPNASLNSSSSSASESYAVTFLDCQGNTVKVELVEYGHDAAAPKGYGTYSGYTNVTAHMDLRPDSCYIAPNTADD